MSNFIILIGGPGEYDACDKDHDAAWANYVAPIQVAMQNGHLKAEPGEMMHWLVYEPAYVARWNDDIGRNSKFDFIQKQVKIVKSKGATSYMDRISTIAKNLGVKLVKIQRKQEFWNYLNSLPDGSISRVWYSGHADPGGLILKVIHTNPNAPQCDPRYYPAEQITVGEIQRFFKPKFSPNPKPSKFLGCNTLDFAKRWNSFYGVPTEGANGKVHFGTLHTGKASVSAIKRISDSSTIKWETIK